MATGHSIRFEFERGWVESKVVCHEPDGADCRLTSVSCECEQWGEIQRRDDGTIWHRILDEGPMEPLWHEVKAADYCNVELFINESDVVLELATKGTEFTIADIPIKPIWDGDGYEWEPADKDPQPARTDGYCCDRCRSEERE